MKKLTILIIPIFLILNGCASKKTSITLEPLIFKNIGELIYTYSEGIIYNLDGDSTLSYRQGCIMPINSRIACFLYFKGEIWDIKNNLKFLYADGEIREVHPEYAEEKEKIKEHEKTMATFETKEDIKKDRKKYDQIIKKHYKEKNKPKYTIKSYSDGTYDVYEN